MSESKNQSKEDIQNVTEMLDMVSEKIPALLRGIKETFFSEEAGRETGKAVGAFYQELIKAGFSHDDATSMAMTYMNSVRNTMQGLKIEKSDDN
jgi:septation ring formation regulator EzrA